MRPVRTERAARVKLSTYGELLMEKQKLKNYYAISEKQLQIAYAKAKAGIGQAHEKLFLSLEQRLGCGGLPRRLRPDHFRREAVCEPRSHPRRRQACRPFQLSAEGRPDHLPSMPAKISGCRRDGQEGQCDDSAVHGSRSRESQGDKLEWEKTFSQTNMKINELARFRGKLAQSRNGAQNVPHVRRGRAGGGKAVRLRAHEHAHRRCGRGSGGARAAREHAVGGVRARRFRTSSRS